MRTEDELVAAYDGFGEEVDALRKTLEVGFLTIGACILLNGSPVADAPTNIDEAMNEAILVRNQAKEAME